MIPLARASMELYLNITTDVERLRLELDEIKEDLFEPKDGNPQLLVKRLVGISREKKNKSYTVSQLQVVESATQLTKLSSVSGPSASTLNL
jgi:hypothetical protein